MTITDIDVNVLKDLDWRPEGQLRVWVGRLFGQNKVSEILECDENWIHFDVVWHVGSTGRYLTRAEAMEVLASLGYSRIEQVGRETLSADGRPYGAVTKWLLEA